MKTATINPNLSVRTFLCVWIEAGQQCEVRLTIEDLLRADPPKKMGSQFEYIYALQGSVDKILDMKINDQMPYQFNRDNKTSQGVMCRIK